MDTLATSSKYAWFNEARQSYSTSSLSQERVDSMIGSSCISLGAKQSICLGLVDSKQGVHRAMERAIMAEALSRQYHFQSDRPQIDAAVHHQPGRECSAEDENMRT